MLMSGESCLGRFDVHPKGPVILYAAEDSPAAIRGRVAHGQKSQKSASTMQADSQKSGRTTST
jgi:hypothetical protein